MSNPTLKRSRVDISIACTDGYSSKFTVSDKSVITDQSRGEMPLIALQDALDELARLVAVYGSPEAAIATTKEAVERVVAWKKEQGL